MADVEAEAAFLSSMQAMNESSGGYNTVENHSGEHIESSDEYDPAQDVQDISLPDHPNHTSPFVESPTEPQSRPTSTNPNSSAFPVPNSTSDHNANEERPATSNSVKSPASGPPMINTLGKAAATALTGSPRSATFKPRLPNDTIGILEDRLKEDEKGDIDAWLGLINEHKKRGKLDDVRKVYERFFAVFPHAVRMGPTCAFLS